MTETREDLTEEQLLRYFGPLGDKSPKPQKLIIIQDNFEFPFPIGSGKRQEILCWGLTNKIIIQE